MLLMQVLESATANWLAYNTVWAFRFTVIPSTVFEASDKTAPSLYISQQLAPFPKDGKGAH